MKKIVNIVRCTLCILLLGLGIFAYLAGTDIYHGTELDLSMEWTIFCLYFYLSYLFIVISVVDFFIKEK